MIFYHFTCPWRFWSEDWKGQYPCVPVRDLLPSNAQYVDGAPAPWCIPVVWLTTSTETMPADDPDIMRLRLTIRLPTTDLKLRSFAKWQGTDILPPALREKAAAHWWTYRGVIPAKRITEINPVMGQYPWWEE
jgi:hypothetical protein